MLRVAVQAVVQAAAELAVTVVALAQGVVVDQAAAQGVVVAPAGAQGVTVDRAARPARPALAITKMTIAPRAHLRMMN